MADVRRITMVAAALAIGTAAALAVVALAPSTSTSVSVDGEATASRSPTGPVGTPNRTRATPEPESATAPRAPVAAARPEPSDDRQAPSSRHGSSRSVPSRSAGPGMADEVPGEDAAEDAVEEGPGDGFQDAASAQRAEWLEERMTEFIDIIVPEHEGSGMSRSCDADGMLCTFEGPATDDFATRWVQALSAGDMDESTLQGTRLRDFSFYETDDGLQFSITAKHPK